MIFAYTTRTIADENVPSRPHRESKSSNRTMACCAGGNNTFKCGWFMWDVFIENREGSNVVEEDLRRRFRFVCADIGWPGGRHAAGEGAGRCRSGDRLRRGLHRLGAHDDRLR